MDNKEITIEDLARMVKNGFDKTASKTDIERLEKKVGTVDSRLDSMEHKVNQIDRRLFSIEEDMADIKIEQYKKLDRRVTVVERKLGIEGAR